MRAELWEKKLAMMRQFDGAGLTIQEVADRLGWCVATARKYQKMTDADIRRVCRKVEPSERNKAIAAMFRVGKTLQEIGELHGISRERVRQILSRDFELCANDGGKSIKIEARKAARKQAKDAKSIAMYGCPHAEYMRISRYGKRRVENGERPCRNPVTAFNSQRTTARSRGIEWNLKLWDWWQIWQSSGRWDERGREKGQYVMCRFKDAGAYEVGNVYIASNSHNCSFQPNNPHRSGHPDHEDVVREKRVRMSVASARRGLRKKHNGLPVGVTVQNGRFIAQISTDGKNRNLGSFGSPEEARAAYRNALSAYLSANSGASA